MNVHPLSPLVLQVATGGDRNFGYLVADEKGRKAALIDPSPVPGELVRAARDRRFDLVYLFVTHGHPDHTVGAGKAGSLTGLRCLGLGDRHESTGREVVHAARFPLGGLEVEVLHTPGHTSDSICLHIGDALFTGDTLFVGKVGGTDLGGGARAQYDALHRVLLALPDDTRVYPGHDYGAAPQSTIGEERRENPFLIQPDLSSFIDLKKNWAAYKLAQGIT